MKILHIITSLGSGGAEKVLYDVATNQSSNHFEHVIVSIKDLGLYGEKFRQHNIKVYTLNVSKLKPWRLLALIKILNIEKPDVIQSWLYHADLLTIIPYILGYKNIIWNIRNNKLSWSSSSKTTIIIRKLCAWLSFIPKQIICCANIARDEHIRIGYNRDKFVIISNGYDFTKFIKNSELRDRLRKELAISDSEFIIGNVGRFDPAKDHKTLLLALQLVKKKNIDFRVLLIGKNIDWLNKDLLDFIKLADLENHMILLGHIDDVNKYYNVMDLFVLSSESEAFPNVVAESMLCGVPCVVTNVGDAADIVGDTGLIVPPKSSETLAAAILEMLQLSVEEFQDMGRLARLRIMQYFSLHNMIHSYEDLYLTMGHK